MQSIGTPAAPVGHGRVTCPRPFPAVHFPARLIADGQTWIDMIDHRNMLFHTYDPACFQEAVESIHARYLAALIQVRDLLAGRRPT